MKRYPLILFSMLFVLFGNIYSQTQHPDFLWERTCPFPIIHTLRWEYPVCTVLDGEIDGCYLIAVSDYRNFETYETDSIFYSPMVYKVSKEGELVAEFALGYEDRFSFILGIVQHPNIPNCCLALGFFHDNVLHYDRPFLAKFDHDLNLIWQKEIELPESFHKYLSSGFDIDSDGNFICRTTAWDPEDFHGALLHPLLWRLTPEGEIENMFEYPYPCRFPPMGGEVFAFPDGSGDYGLVVEEGNDRQVMLARFNRNLELVSRQAVTKIYHEENLAAGHILNLELQFVPGCLPLADSSMIVAGVGTLTRQELYQFPLTSDEVIGFIWVNSSNEAVSYATVGEGPLGQGNAQSDSITVANTIHLLRNDAIYFSYMRGGHEGFDYDYTTYFIVTKMDFQGNVIWQRSWNKYQPENGMKVYLPHRMTTTSDDGCLLCGYSYYSDVNNPGSDVPKPEVFLLKFFSDGSLSIPGIETDVHIRPYWFYPNPVDKQLHLQYSPDIRPVSVELFDMQGRLVLSQEKDLETLGLESLPAGVYTLRVTLGNGTSYSDSVVKQ